MPVKVIGADPHVRHDFLPACSMLGSRAVDFEFIPETTHLAQLEKPEECARVTIEFLRRAGLGPASGGPSDFAFLA